MAERGSGAKNGGIGLGGILVILGVVLMIVWSFWIGLIIALIGRVAFGGARALQVVLNAASYAVMEVGTSLPRGPDHTRTPS